MSTEEIERLVIGLRSIVKMYEAKNLRTADFHGEECACYRCAVDACDAAANALPELLAENARLSEAHRKTTMDAMRFKGICVQADLWANTPSPNYWAKVETRPVPDHGSGPISTKETP